MVIKAHLQCVAGDQGQRLPRLLRGGGMQPNEAASQAGGSLAADTFGFGQRQAIKSMPKLIYLLAT